MHLSSRNRSFVGLVAALLTVSATSAVWDATQEQADAAAPTGVRLLDSRLAGDTIDSQNAGGGFVAAGSITTVRVAGRGGIPNNARAASINLTAVIPDADGYATVFPCGAPTPTASNLNFTAGSTVANSVLTRLGTNGDICIYSSARTHLIADVSGAFTTDAYTSIDPARLIDTRPGTRTFDNQNVGGGSVAAGSITTLRVAGRGGVPANARAASINLTAAIPDADGYATVFPCGAPTPTASNLNFTAGSTVANSVLTRLGTNGDICIYTSARTHLIADVSGAFTTDAYTSIDPARLIDTRPGTRTFDNQNVGGGSVAAGSITTLRVAGRGGVPANARAASINLTAAIPDADGYATVFPCGAPTPNASNLNFTAGSTVANSVLTRLGTNGDICIYTSARTHLIADVSGAFTTDAYTVVNPARLIDTRPVPAPPAAPVGGNGLAVDESAIPAPAGGFSSSRIGAASSTPFSNDAVGAFRINCFLSHMNFDDPIVFPGQSRATHLHSFFGNTGVNAASNNTSINTSGNSTCTGGTENRSAYWAPAVIDTATNRPVNQSAGSAIDTENSLQVYYKSGYQGVASNSVQNFPPGLRMIAGDSRRTTNTPSSVTAVSYHCEGAGPSGNSPQFPNCPAGDLFVMSVMFPQCWDGRNLDSPDHKSHMSYGTWGPVPGQNGAGCSASHPVPLTEITQNYRFRVPANGMSTWRLSSDTYTGPAGYSGHADWWNGWNLATFQRVIDNCFRSGLDCRMNLLGDGQALN